MTERIEAYVTFLSADDGGRHQPALNSPLYRPHVVVGDPCQRTALVDDRSYGTEEYLGVSFDGDGTPLRAGPAHQVMLRTLYAPKVDYSALVAGQTFTVREGPAVVAFGVVNPPAIYADFNGIENLGRVAAIHLHRMGSLLDLSRLGLILHEGMRLRIYMDSDEVEDLEADATALFDRDTKHWFAKFERDEIRSVPKHPEWTGGKFPCVSCRYDLQPGIGTTGLSLADLCPRCGNKVHRPLEPPPP